MGFPLMLINLRGFVAIIWHSFAPFKLNRCTQNNMTVIRTSTTTGWIYIDIQTL